METRMSMASEFKEFIAKGNVIYLDVAVVIGAAFGKIVTAFVDKIIMPPIGLLIGGVDFSKWAIILKDATVNAAGEAVPAVAIGIGEFLNTLIQFVIIALAVFMVVKAINKATKKENPAAAAEPTIPADVTLLTEIRDLLRNRTP